MSQSTPITGVNLIPAHRRTARSRRRRVRAWTVGGTLYVAAVLAACGVLHVTWERDARAVAKELASAGEAVKSAEADVTALRRKLAQLTVRRQNAKALTDQPDWSILLAALGRTVGDEAMLRDLRLTSAPEPPPAPPAAPATSTGAAAAGAKPAASTRPKLNKYAVEIRGLCRSPSGVSRFVLRLQESGLFDDVKLVRTGRDAAGATGSSSQQQEPAVTFELACTIGDVIP